jgi:hypothetical protein
MDWIERWFGIAPDNGDGSLELLLTLFAVASAIVLVAMAHRKTRWALFGFLARSRDSVRRVVR